MMNMQRQKSKSKLSSADLHKLKKTIKEALKKPEPKQNNETPLKRSSTAQSLTSNKKSHTPFTTLTRNNSAKKIHPQENLARRKPFFSQQKITKNETIIEYFRWYHAEEHELQFQQKHEMQGKKRINLQYFASFNRQTKKKSLILAVQNDEIFVAYGKIQCYGVNRTFHVYEKLQTKIKADKKYSFMLILGYSEKWQQQFPVEEILKGKNENELLDSLVKGKQKRKIPIKFYLILRLQHDKNELKQLEMENIKKILNKFVKK